MSGTVGGGNRRWLLPLVAVVLTGLLGGVLLWTLHGRQGSGPAVPVALGSLEGAEGVVDRAGLLDDVGHRQQARAHRQGDRGQGAGPGRRGVLGQQSLGRRRDGEAGGRRLRQPARGGAGLAEERLRQAAARRDQQQQPERGLTQGSSPGRPAGTRTGA